MTQPNASEPLREVVSAAVEWVDAHDLLTTGSDTTSAADLVERYSKACRQLLASVSQNRAALAAPPPALDAETLARALAIAEVNCWANPFSGHKVTDVDEDRAHRQDAEAIIAALPEALR